MLFTRLRRYAAGLALVCLVPVGATGAQQTTPTVATAVPANSIIPSSAADTLEALMMARGTDTVRLEKDRLLGERRDAESRWAALSEQAVRLRAAVGELKDGISAATAKEKLARKDKRDADRISAASEKRRMERSLELIQARLALREAQAEAARVERDHIDATIRADDAELAIAERRDQVSPEDTTQRTAFQELTSRWLQALRTKVARAYDLEDRRFKVVEAQMQLLKRQRA